MIFLYPYNLDALNNDNKILSSSESSPIIKKRNISPTAYLRIALPNRRNNYSNTI